MNSCIFENSLSSVFDADASSTSNHENNQGLVTSFLSAVKQVSSDSDDNDIDGEKCAICLKQFRTQQVGSPSNCDHCFCRNCLEEWSKVKELEILLT